MIGNYREIVNEGFRSNRVTYRPGYNDFLEKSVGLMVVRVDHSKRREGAACLANVASFFLPSVLLA